jgi:hypothetical protein
MKAPGRIRTPTPSASIHLFSPRRGRLWLASKGGKIPVQEDGVGAMIHLVV